MIVVFVPYLYNYIKLQIRHDLGNDQDTLRLDQRLMKTGFVTNQSLREVHLSMHFPPVCSICKIGIDTFYFTPLQGILPLPA